MYSFVLENNLDKNPVYFQTATVFGTFANNEALENLNIKRVNILIISLLLIYMLILIIILLLVFILIYYILYFTYYKLQYIINFKKY